MNKSTDESFSFDRSRGIVWVCDINNSSKYLNDSEQIEYFEEFLLRFHWISRRIVSASDGQYIKWTGDGFLAWYECPLKRNLINLTNQVVDAAWHTTFITNITQMGLTNDIKISIRNSLTFEEDALLTYITSSGNDSIDILGRYVVLGFRLSSIPSAFPNITIHADLNNDLMYKTNKINFSHEEINKYFKGEFWQTDNIYQLSALINKNRAAISSENREPLPFHYKIQDELRKGPNWTQELLKIYIDFLKNMEELIMKFNKENSTTPNRSLENK